MKVDLTRRDLEQILTALENRGDHRNGDARYRGLYGYLQAAAITNTDSESSATHTDKMVDVTAPTLVEIEVRADGTVVWVHVNGITALRACRIGKLVVTDHRTIPAGSGVRFYWNRDPGMPPSERLDTGPDDDSLLA
jgi:hypothetical protein